MGTNVGDDVLTVGSTDGLLVLGVAVGSLLGALDGITDGTLLGAVDGLDEGALLGAADGFMEGADDGFRLGVEDGFAVGRKDGEHVGSIVGFAEGSAVGFVLGFRVGEKLALGAKLITTGRREIDIVQVPPDKETVGELLDNATTEGITRVDEG